MPELKYKPQRSLEEIYEIRESIYETIKDMTVEEMNAYFNKSVEIFQQKMKERREERAMKNIVGN
jgi:shikimate kinase